MSKTLFFAPLAALALTLPCMALAQAAPAPVGKQEAAEARATGYRALAGDFDGAAYFPSDWAAAEALLEAAWATVGANAAVAAFDAAGDAFASIFRLSVSLYAQAREDEIAMIRDGLVAAGARALFPELMGPADGVALEALDRYEAGDHREARDLAARAYAMFGALEAAFDAWRTRGEIVRRGFADGARENYEIAEETLLGAIQSYLAGDFGLAREYAAEARARYGLVLSAGWASRAESLALRARGGRDAALEVRANVAAADFFGDADSTYAEAACLLRREYYREAAERFSDAASLYFTAAASALARRAIAAEAISEARGRINEAIRAAQRRDLTHSKQ